jgi:hypothetical protein
MTEELIATVEMHLAEQAAFLRAWRVARLPVVRPTMTAEQVAQSQDDVNKFANGHDPEKPKRKGGWPRGRSRKPKNEGATQ